MSSKLKETIICLLETLLLLSLAASALAVLALATRNARTTCVVSSPSEDDYSCGLEWLLFPSCGDGGAFGVSREVSSYKITRTCPINRSTQIASYVSVLFIMGLLRFIRKRLSNRAYVNNEGVVVVAGLFAFPSFMTVIIMMTIELVKGRKQFDEYGDMYKYSSPYLISHIFIYVYLIIVAVLGIRYDLKASNDRFNWLRCILCLPRKNDSWSSFRRRANNTPQVRPPPPPQIPTISTIQDQSMNISQSYMGDYNPTIASASQYHQSRNVAGHNQRNVNLAVPVPQYQQSRMRSAQHRRYLNQAAQGQSGNQVLYNRGYYDQSISAVQDQSMNFTEKSGDYDVDFDPDYNTQMRA